MRCKVNGYEQIDNFAWVIVERPSEDDVLKLAKQLLIYRLGRHETGEGRPATPRCTWWSKKEHISNILDTHSTLKGALKDLLPSTSIMVPTATFLTVNGDCSYQKYYSTSFASKKTIDKIKLFMVRVNHHQDDPALRTPRGLVRSHQNIFRSVFPASQ